MEEVIKAIIEKYKSMKQDPEMYLKGLFYSKPLTYWDYVEVDTLLSLQKPRTDFDDEPIFIMYHQITELTLKLIRHELNQITNDDLAIEKFTTKVQRMIRYTELLKNSFSIMTVGLDYDEYSQFRLTLAPASGFQSAQFRFIELQCTDMQNLINESGLKRVAKDSTNEKKFEYLYWKEAGVNPETGEITTTLKFFQEKYENDLIMHAEKYKNNNVLQKFLKLNKSEEGYDKLKEELRNFDRVYNIEWPVVHLGTANRYLNRKGENKPATGGSHWQKYLHPAFQRRKFFPELWSEEEIKNWGKEYL